MNMNGHHHLGGPSTITSTSAGVNRPIDRPSTRLAEYSDSATVESESNHSSSSSGGAGSGSGSGGGGGRLNAMIDHINNYNNYSYAHNNVKYVSNSGIALRSQTGGSSGEGYSSGNGKSFGGRIDAGDGVPSAFDPFPRRVQQQQQPFNGYGNKPTTSTTAGLHSTGSIASITGSECNSRLTGDDLNVKSETDSILSEFLTNLKFEEANNNSSLLGGNMVNGCITSTHPQPQQQQQQPQTNTQKSLGKII